MFTRPRLQRFQPSLQNSMHGITLRRESQEESAMQSSEMETPTSERRSVRCDDHLDRLLSKQALPRAVAACAFLGCRTGKGIHVSDECLSYLFIAGGGTLQESLAGGTLLQMAKTAFENKKFWGTTENAVRIQIYSAICAYCLVAIVQHDMQLKRSTYEVLQILGVSLTDKTPLFDLFNNNQLNDFKELNNSNGQLLLNF